MDPLILLRLLLRGWMEGKVMALGHACESFPLARWRGKRSSHLVNVAKKGRREGRRISEYCPSERGKASIGVAKQQRGLPVHMRRCAGAALSLPLSACCCGLMAFRGARSRPLFLFCTLESIKALSLSFCAGFDDLLQIGTRGERDRLSERLSKMVWP